MQLSKKRTAQKVEAVGKVVGETHLEQFWLPGV